MPTTHAPLVTQTTTAEFPTSLEPATLRQRGLLDVLFASADASGDMVALMLDSERPGVIAVVRSDAAGALAVETRAGNLVPAGSPLVLRLDESTDEVHLEDLATGAQYRAPNRVSGVPGDGCCTWHDETTWRLAADRPGAGLLRAVTNGEQTWTLIDFYAPDDPTPRWRITLRPGAGPTFVADAALSRDARLALVQLTDGNKEARLVAYDTATGEIAWSVDTAPTSWSSGALAISDDGATVVTVLADRDRPDRCESCERVELRSVATGALVRTVGLETSTTTPPIAAVYQPLGVEVYLGVLGDELWYRFRRPRQHRDSMQVGGVAYDVFDLHTGRIRAIDPAWASAFDDPDRPLLALPIRGGVLAVRSLHPLRLEVTRFDRAP